MFSLSGLGFEASRKAALPGAAFSVSSLLSWVKLQGSQHSSQLSYACCRFSGARPCVVACATPTRRKHTLSASSCQQVQVVYVSPAHVHKETSCCTMSVPENRVIHPCLLPNMSHIPPNLPGSNEAHTVAFHEPPRGFGVRSHDPRPGRLPARGHAAPAMPGAAGGPCARSCGHGDAGPLLRPIRLGAGRARPCSAHLRLPRHRRVPASPASARGCATGLTSTPRGPWHGRGRPIPAYRCSRSATAWADTPSACAMAAGTSRAPRWSARRWLGSATSRAPPNACASAACSR